MHIFADFISHLPLHSCEGGCEGRTDRRAVCEDEVDGYGFSLDQIAIKMPRITILVQYLNIRNDQLSGWTQNTACNTGRCRRGHGRVHTFADSVACAEAFVVD